MAVDGVADLDLPLFAPAQIAARANRENFPVALRCLPRSTRSHLLAIYAFARLVDDIGDEPLGHGTLSPVDRVALLDWIERDLEHAYTATPRHPVVRQLADTIRTLSLPFEPFKNLIEANRRDQSVRRYQTYEALLEYCALSANPVGRLVLHVFQLATADRIVHADRICTALQIIEHCQDVAEDRARDRIYLPAQDLVRFGCREEDLLASHASPALRRLIAFELERSRHLLTEGEALVAMARGWARLAIAGYLAGGHAAADAIAAAEFDVVAVAVRPRRRDVLRSMLTLLRRAGKWR